MSAFELPETAALTATVLGRLDTEHDEDLGLSRIVGLRLECDGHRPHWLTPGEPYELRHDGFDWSVRGGEWGRARLTRLGAPVRALPVHRELVPLDPCAVYVIHPRPRTGWELRRLNP